MEKQIIYTLINEAMPGYVKIGYTAGSLEERLRQLDTTGVPLPFECFCAYEINENKGVERRLHDAFDDVRVRSSREFFEIAPERVVAALQIADGIDVTPNIVVFIAIACGIITICALITSAIANITSISKNIELFVQSRDIEVKETSHTILINYTKIIFGLVAFCVILGVIIFGFYSYDQGKKDRALKYFSQYMHDSEFVQKIAKSTDGMNEKFFTKEKRAVYKEYNKKNISEHIRLLDENYAEMRTLSKDLSKELQGLIQTLDAHSDISVGDMSLITRTSDKRYITVARASDHYTSFIDGNDYETEIISDQNSERINNVKKADDMKALFSVYRNELDKQEGKYFKNLIIPVKISENEEWYIFAKYKEKK